LSSDEDQIYAPTRRRGLRTGFTTGACATAASVAAACWLLRGETPPSVTIHLPAGRDAEFEIASRTREADWVRCSVIKDGGDDPDVTHGAEIQVRLWRPHEPGLHFAAGPGVGTVTRPGLGLEVGGPAINPVPRRMISEHLEALAADVVLAEGLTVEVSIPNGEQLAKKTLNGRLGIVGGLSILGTTGIVIPYSTAAWRASVEQAIDVAAANGQRQVVLSTGGRSEQFAQRIIDLPEVAFVEMGEFTGHALKRCVQRGVRTASLAGMIGKMSKIALGHFMTHVAGNQVDLMFLADVARECGASRAVEQEIRGANTARHFQEIALRGGLHAVFGRLCEMVCERGDSLVGGELALECIIFDFDGTVLGRARSVEWAA
jgi:cobalt-precorrin-5B (C1)-methyltransferase